MKCSYHPISQWKMWMQQWLAKHKNSFVILFRLLQSNGFQCYGIPLKEVTLFFWSLFSANWGPSMLRKFNKSPITFLEGFLVLKHFVGWFELIIFILLHFQTFHFQWAFFSYLCLCCGWPVGSHSIAIAPSYKRCGFFFLKQKIINNT